MDEQPRPPGLVIRAMAVFVVLFVLVALVVVPITMGTWDWVTVTIALVGLALVGVWALFGLRVSRRRAREHPEDDGEPPPES